MPDVSVQRVDPIALAVVRRQGQGKALARIVPEACGIVWNAIRAQQLRGGRHVAVYRDDVIAVDVGVEMAVPFAESGDVVRAQTPGGTVASATHFGPYDRLNEAHEAIRRWCHANRRSIAGPRWEIYGHWDSAWDADPSRIRTDVYYLLD